MAAIAFFILPPGRSHDAAGGGIGARRLFLEGAEMGRVFPLCYGGDVPTTDPPFREANEGIRSREELSLLEQRISDLQLRIEGTYLELLIAQLHDELEGRGLRLRPRCYLSDE